MRRSARPPSGRAQRGQTLILIFLGTLLLGATTAGAVFGGAPVPTLRQHVREAMTDQAQRELADRTLDRIVAEAAREDDERKQFEQAVFAELARHDATPADLQPLIARGDALHLRMHRSFLDLRYELRSHLTAEQWQKVFEAAAASAPVR